MTRADNPIHSGVRAMVISTSNGDGLTVAAMVEAVVSVIRTTESYSYRDAVTAVLNNDVALSEEALREFVTLGLEIAVQHYYSHHRSDLRRSPERVAFIPMRLPTRTDPSPPKRVVIKTISTLTAREVLGAPGCTYAGHNGIAKPILRFTVADREAFHGRVVYASRAVEKLIEFDDALGEAFSQHPEATTVADMPDTTLEALVAAFRYSDLGSNVAAALLRPATSE